MKGTADWTISEAQEKVDEWIRTVGVRYFDPLTNTALLMEEVGELARVMARVHGEQSSKKGEELNMAEEMADVMFVLMCLANQNGVNLDEALKASFEKKTNRDSDRHRTNEKLK